MHDPLSTDAPRRPAVPHAHQIPVRVEPQDRAAAALKRANAKVRSARYGLRTPFPPGRAPAPRRGRRGRAARELDAAVKHLRDVARALGVEL